MKLILAIVSNDDSSSVSAALTKSGYSVTKMATTGAFLMSGNTTFLVGTEDEKVDAVISIIKKQSHRRTQMMPTTHNNNVFDNSMFNSSYPVEVTVGGATIFVLDVDRFEKA